MELNLTGGALLAGRPRNGGLALGLVRRRLWSGRWPCLRGRGCRAPTCSTFGPLRLRNGGAPAVALGPPVSSTVEAAATGRLFTGRERRGAR